MFCKYDLAPETILISAEDTSQPVLRMVYYCKVLLTSGNLVERF